MTPAEAREILYLALAEPIGLLLRTNDPGRARQRLYAAKREMPEASGLQFRIWPSEDGDLVVVNEKVQQQVQVLAEI